MLPSFETYGTLYLVLGAVLLAGLLARRVPVLRVLVSIASWVVLAGLLVVAVAQRERFDPYLGQIASMLRLSEQEVVGTEMRIRMSPDGHFWARVRIGDTTRRMLVDSGATLTALSARTADEAGIAPKPSLVPVPLRTANGTVPLRVIVLTAVRIGDVEVANVEAAVHPGALGVVLLGNSFLTRFQMKRENDVMRLEKRN